MQGQPDRRGLCRSCLSGTTRKEAGAVLEQLRAENALWRLPFTIAERTTTQNTGSYFTPTNQPTVYSSPGVTFNIFQRRRREGGAPATHSIQKQESF